MASSSTITACGLTLACWLCQPCSGFVSSSLTHAAAVGRHASLQRVQPVAVVGVVQQPTRTSWKRNLSHLAGKRRGRGSVGGASMVAAPSELWDSYLGALEAAPLLTKSITAGMIFPAADATAQIFDKEKGQDGFDFARTLRWLFFGFAVQAPWNHFFYVLLDGALPPTVDPLSMTTAVKVFIDQFIQAPIFTVVIFGVLGLLEGKTIADIREQLGQDYKNTMLANWTVFVPAAVVNLAVCPPELRVLFLNVVFFAWTIYLSTVVSKGGSKAAEEA